MPKPFGKQWHIRPACNVSATEVVRLWRQSFQRAMGLPEQNEPAEFHQHVAFYRRIPAERVTLVCSRGDALLAGMLVQYNDVIEHLYVHVERQGLGIGKYLLYVAQSASRSRLRLHTFQVNRSAQRFYRSQGFVEVARGMAAWADNPWATSPVQLADIEYQWRPATSWPH